MRMPTAALATLLALPASAGAARGQQIDAKCSLRAGPDDLVVSGEDLVIEAGKKKKQVVAVRGNVVVKGGAEVSKAVAIGGTVTLEPGAVVLEDAVAIGGDVLVRDEARVGKDAVALGGKVRADPKARVDGSSVALSLDVGGKNLAQSIVDEIVGPSGRCTIVSSPR